MTLLRARSHAPRTKAFARNATAIVLFAVVGYQGANHMRHSWRRIAVASAAPRIGPLLVDMQMRDLGMRISSAASHEPLTVMASPWVSCRMHFFSPCLGVGTLFWENVEGIHATADFFADYGDVDARRIAIQRNIDFVIVPFSRTSAFAASMHDIKHGNAVPENVQRTLAYRLAKRKNYPDWLLPVPLAGVPAGRNWLMYRVGPLDDR